LLLDYITWQESSLKEVDICQLYSRIKLASFIINDIIDQMGHVRNTERKRILMIHAFKVYHMNQMIYLGSASTYRSSYEKDIREID
jgi:hypothetical protein